ncbi:MAG: aldose 1-epimerase family protein [bacterium]
MIRRPMQKENNWVLTDVKAGIWRDTFSITAETAGCQGTGDWSIVKRTLHGGFAEGVDVIDVNNGALSFTIVPTRGMGLWKGRFDGCEIGWRSPVTGPVNPLYVNAWDAGGLGWLQGFDECIVRCGLNSNGAPGKDIVVDNNGNPSEIMLPLHGRIANIPANGVTVAVKEAGGTTELVVSGTVDEGMLFFPCLRLETRISTVVGSNSVTIHDEVVNMNTVERELELLYHCNFGEPFLGKGSRLVAPSRWVEPRDAQAEEGLKGYDTYLPPTPGYIEQVYFHQFCADRKGNTVAMLRDKAGSKGVALRYNIRQLPCFTQWKNTVGEGDGYATGLEPGTNFPNPKSLERQKGRVIRLAPAQRHVVDLTLEVHTTAQGVASVEKEIVALRNGKQAHVRKARVD